MADAPEKYDPERKAMLTLLGERMDERRQALGVNWTEVAWKARTGESLVRKWLTLRSEPRMKGLKDLAQALETSTD